MRACSCFGQHTPFAFSLPSWCSSNSRDPSATILSPTADWTGPGMHVLAVTPSSSTLLAGCCILVQSCDLFWMRLRFRFLSSCEFHGSSHTAHRIQQHVFTSTSPLPRSLAAARPRLGCARSCFSPVASLCSPFFHTTLLIELLQ